MRIAVLVLEEYCFKLDTYIFAYTYKSETDINSLMFPVLVFLLNWYTIYHIRMKKLSRLHWLCFYEKSIELCINEQYFIFFKRFIPSALVKHTFQK